MSKLQLEVENLIFRKHGYNSGFIDSRIKKLAFFTVCKKELFIILPYLGKVSIQTRSRLSKFVKIYLSLKLM